MDSVREAASRAKEASYALQSLPLSVRNAALQAIARQMEFQKGEILAANQHDLEEGRRNDLGAVLLKRLKYDDEKIQESIRSIHSLLGQEDVVGRVLSVTELDEGLILEKVSCPIGVIGVVFESRPDALVQISTLCLRSGNAVLLKGGSEARHTNSILAKIINEAIIAVDRRFQYAVQNLSSREEFRQLLALDGLVDLIIPRGSNELVHSIQASTKIPVLGHAAGICHAYVDERVDLDMAVRVCYDAKVQYPAVCNAIETLLVHQGIADRFLPLMAEKYHEAGVELRGDAATQGLIKAKLAAEEDWSTEYNDMILSIRIVHSLDEAIAHINRYGSHHSDVIISDDPVAAQRFQELVDSSSVMWNCSTRFADGFRYGLGAEVGISTNKTHARGPVGMEGLTIYKWRLSGKGHIVADYVGKDARSFTHRKIA